MWTRTTIKKSLTGKCSNAGFLGLSCISGGRLRTHPFRNESLSETQDNWKVFFHGVLQECGANLLTVWVCQSRTEVSCQDHLLFLSVLSKKCTFRLSHQNEVKCSKHTDSWGPTFLWGPITHLANLQRLSSKVRVQAGCCAVGWMPPAWLPTRCNPPPCASFLTDLTPLSLLVSLGNRDSSHCKAVGRLQFLLKAPQSSSIYGLQQVLKQCLLSKTIN